MYLPSGVLVRHPRQTKLSEDCSGRHMLVFYWSEAERIEFHNKGVIFLVCLLMSAMWHMFAVTTFFFLFSRGKGDPLSSDFFFQDSAWRGGGRGISIASSFFQILLGRLGTRAYYWQADGNYFNVVALFWHRAKKINTLLFASTSCGVIILFPLCESDSGEKNRFCS